MHVVYLRDPWFGSYYRIQGATGMNLPAPVLILGPATIRSIRLESLKNQGEVVKIQGYNDRPCQHTYVEGEIEGVPDPLPTQWGVFRSFIEHFQSESVQTGQLPFVMGTLTAKVNLEVTETSDYAQLDVSFETEARTPGRVMDHIVNHCRIRCRLVEDPNTGTVTYDDWTIVSRDGDRADQISLVSVANPYGVAFDHLGPLLSQVNKYISTCMEKRSKAPKYNNTRDVAIYEAIENLSLSNVNWLETFKDLAEPLAAIKQLLQFFKGGWGLSGILKKIANFHLFWKYVIKTGLLTATQLRRLLEFLVSNNGHIIDMINGMLMIGNGNARDELTIDGQTISCDWFAKLTYGPDTSTLDAFLNRVKALGLTPKVGDLWDLIPYSFVVDWLIPVGDTLYHLEEASMVQRLPLKVMVLTCVTQWHFSHSFRVNGKTFNVDLRIVNYDRKVKRSLPSNMWLGVRFRDVRKQTLTATALLIQRFIR